ncbi:WD40/YVTN/BNR-like repeat-containing protein [Roseateles chitinivorans]|uniref:WD40/YVTN/BNR-like repeat-containing protein n=1 Tax=Roseateles chitinivorans TaxID=2917965 RepID=UPI003D672EB7
MDVTCLDLLSVEDYSKRFRGFGIRDCAVIDRELFYFVSVQDWDDDRPRPFHDELETRLTKLQLNAEKRWLSTTMTGYSRLKCSGPREGDVVCFAVDGMGQVLAKKLEGSRDESNVPGGGGVGPCRGSVNRLKPLFGRLYGGGDGRSLFHRVGPEQWREVGPLPPEGRGETGFQDFDGFSETDLYAAGGQGDVWRYDGSAWLRVRFPSKMWLESVCCGGDGLVYIGAQSGTVYRGRGDDWTMIHRGDLSLPFRDMVWFQDRVYATSDYGLWEIQDGVVRRSEAPIEITNCAGNLSVADGVMLMAGHSGAALHDGQSWTRLFSIAELARNARK